MSSVLSRIRAVEKKVGAGKDERRDFTLEQLVLASMGKEVGPPADILKPGEKGLTVLLQEATARRKDHP